MEDLSSDQAPCTRDGDPVRTDPRESSQGIESTFVIAAMRTKDVKHLTAFLLFCLLSARALADVSALVVMEPTNARTA